MNLVFLVCNALLMIANAAMGNVALTIAAGFLFLACFMLEMVRIVLEKLETK